MTTSVTPVEAVRPPPSETVRPGPAIDASGRWSLTYAPGLDGLRAVGMAVMLLFHAEVSRARGAFLALSQFFTLSGFLVAAVLLQRMERDGGVRLKTFWSRRIRRLLPASLAALAGIVLFGATVANGPQRDVLPGQIAAAATWMANWLFVVKDTSYINQFAAPSPVQHFWSLSVEEQFYLLLPLGFAGLYRLTTSRRVLASAVAGVAAASATWMVVLYRSGSGVDRVYYGTDTRMAEILLGVLLAIVMSSVTLPRSPRFWRAVGLAGALCYAVTVWMFTSMPISEPAMWNGGIVLFAAGTCLVILGVVSGSGPLRILRWRPLAAMGRITYGLYLYHLPIFLWLTSERTGLGQWWLLGLRLAVTFPVAIISYHFLEKPIRNRTVLGSGALRLAAGPVAVVALLVAAFVFVPGGGVDPWATLRAGDQAGAGPVGIHADPVLDVLVITDKEGVPLADHLEKISAKDSHLNVVRGGSFDCGDLVESAKGRVCGNWLQRWPKLIEKHNPDVVFLFVDDWATTDLQRVSGEPPSRLPAVAEELLGRGFDLLAAKGAPIVWGTNPSSLINGAARDALPFHRAMQSLLQTRVDVRATEWLPPRAAQATAGYLDQASGTILEALRVNRRVAAAGVPRVMVVGDSQARSVGYGLERLASDTSEMVVWNVAVRGCGLANAGTVLDLISNDEMGPDRQCVAATKAWKEEIRQFDPDIVLVLSSLRDLQDRRLDGQRRFAAVGDGAIDDYLVDTYVSTVDALDRGGAKVVWLLPPCVRFMSPFGGAGKAPAVYDPARMERLRSSVLPAVARARPGHVVLYPLDELLCPRGRFLEQKDGVGEVRPDGLHLSVDASLWVAHVLQREVVDRYGG